MIDLDRRISSILVALALSIVCLTVLFRSGDNVELTTGKHYWGHYYGGFATTAYGGPGHWHTLHNEGHSQFDALQALSGSERTDKGSYLGGPYFDRFFASPILPTMLHRLTLGLVPIQVIYRMTNLILWLGAIAAAMAVGRRLTGSALGGAVPAVLLASYHVFSLNLDSVKMQHAATPMLMFGIWIIECRGAMIAALPRLVRGLFWVSFWFIMLISAGAWLYLLAYWVVRLLATWDRGAAFAAGGAWIVFPLALAWVAAIRSHYGLVSTLGSYHPGEIVTESIAALGEMFAGKIVHDYRFLNYESYEFFANAFIWAKGMVNSNPFVTVLSITALVICPRSHRLLVSAFLLFFLGHATMVLVRGNLWHYGFNDGPTILIQTLAIGVLFVDMMHRRWPLALAFTSVSLAAALVWGLTDYKQKVENYYGGSGYVFGRNLTKNVFACHDMKCREIF